jgi:hypothetical protein
VRNSRRRFCVLGVGECSSGMVLGLQRSQSSSTELLSLQVRFRSRNGRLRCSVFGGTAAGCTGCGGGDNGLPRVAHFLHRRRRSAAKQTGNSDQDKYEP